MRLAISLLFAVLASGICRGQEAAYVDTRPGSQAEPDTISGSAVGGGIGCGGCVLAPDPLKIEIEKMIFLDTSPRPSVEWTLRVTNQTDKPVQLPSSLSWSSAVKSVGVDRRRVLRLYVGQEASCGDPKGKHVKQSAEVLLYGAADKETDVVTLDPGQWLTIVGHGPACAYPRAGTDTYIATVDLSTVDWYKENGDLKSDTRPIYSFLRSAPVKWDGSESYAKPALAAKPDATR